MADNATSVDLTDFYADHSFDQLKTEMVSLKAEMQTGVELADSGSLLSPEQEEKFAKLAVRMSEAGARLDSMNTKQKAQQEKMNQVRSMMEKNYGEDILPQAQGGGSQKAAGESRGVTISQSQQEDLVAKFLAGNHTADIAGPTFRNGRNGTYTAMSMDTIRIGDENNFKLSYIESDVYSKVFSEGIGQSMDHNSIAINASIRYNESCCPATDATPSNFKAGGWLITPMTFAEGIQRCCDRNTVMRQLANVRTVTEACKLGIRRLTKRPQSFAFGCECRPPEKCDGVGGEIKEMEPHLWTQCTVVCNALLRKSIISYEQMLMQELGVDLSESLENAYLYGNGHNQPLGIFHRNALDKSCTFPLKKGTFDPSCLLRMACQLSSCVNGSWLMGKHTYCDILQSTNGCGDYYWWNLIVQNGPGSSGNENSRPSLMGSPVWISEFITDSIDRVGDFPMIYGDFDHYWITDGPTIGIKKQEDIMHDTTCWVARGHTDGMPVNDCRFKRMQVVA